MNVRLPSCAQTFLSIYFLLDDLAVNDVTDRHSTLYEDSELRGSQRRRGPIEETGGAGCSESSSLQFLRDRALSGYQALYSAIQKSRKWTDFFIKVREFFALVFDLGSNKRRITGQK